MPSTQTLTSRQREILDWIKRFVRDQGLPPTVREIGSAFGIQSSSTFSVLKALERKGFLKRGHLGARSLIVEGVAERAGTTAIPVLGRIAAGKPIWAVQDELGTIHVDPSLARGAELYGLLVKGDSMINAGILDGDHVVIRKQETADDGDIVVAVLDDEATLKRLRRKQGKIILEPANPLMKAFTVKPSDLRICGKAVGVQRTL